MNHALFRAWSLAGMWAAAAAWSASAAVTTLTGGDPGEGFAPKWITVAARDLCPNGGQLALTVQTVTATAATACS